MEAETLGKTLARTTSNTQETPKPQDPEGRILREVSRVGDKNGGNRRRRRRGVVNGGSGEEGFGVEDSEIKGASTLLKMQRSGGDSDDEGLSRLGSVLDAIDSNDAGVEERKGFDGSLDANEGAKVVEVSDVDEDGVGDGLVEFSIGDFVWGKVKSHPWWPGRIYSPSQASDYASKIRQRHKMLVAYFGDGTFAWCNSSQLKPFEENFVEMSKQSGSKNFVNAVERSLDEVSRLVDMKMTCYCIPKEKLIEFGRTLVENAGIKVGHLVPEGGIEKFSSGLFEPNRCLSVLKGFAQLPDVNNMLELVVLRSWLSAFYQTKGGQQLPTYHDPQPIPGLEECSNNRAVGSKHSKGKKEVAIEEPAEEDSVASPSDQKSTNGLLKRCQEDPEDSLYRSRKQKSIAEIIVRNEFPEKVSEEDAVVEKEIKKSKTSAAERKKRKGKDEGVDLKGVEDVGNVAKEKATPITLALASQKKQKTAHNESTGEAKCDVRVEPEAGTIEGTPTTSSGRMKRKSIGKLKADLDNSLMAKEGSIKQSKLSKSSEAADCTIASLIKDGSGPTEKLKLSSTRRRKKTGGLGERGSGNEGQERESTSVNVFAQKHDGEAEEPTSKGNLSRERKKSKYLSPPFTTIRKGKMKEELEAGAVIVSSNAQLSERMMRASHNLIGLPPSKSSGKGDEPKAIEKPAAALKTSSLPGPQMPEQYQSIVFDPVKVKAPINEVLSLVKSRACNPQNEKGNNVSGVVGDFLDTFRSSFFSNESENNWAMKNQTGVQRESEKSDSASDDESRQLEIRKSGDPKSDKSKGKQVVTDSPDDKDPAEHDPAVLLVSFGPGSNLPTKDDIINKYAKYGSLNKEETNMFHLNQCAKVVFSKSSAAEAAFNNSQLVSPFEKAHVTFRLRYPANETKTRELRDIAGAKDQANTPSMPSSLQSTNPSPALEPSASIVSQLNYVRGKLEGIAAMLETPDGKISPGLKSKLKGEVKGVLEKVSSMIIGSSS